MASATSVSIKTTAFLEPSDSAIQVRKNASNACKQHTAQASTSRLATQKGQIQITLVSHAPKAQNARGSLQKRMDFAAMDSVSSAEVTLIALGKSENCASSIQGPASSALESMTAGHSQDQSASRMSAFHATMMTTAFICTLMFWDTVCKESAISVGDSAIVQEADWTNSTAIRKNTLVNFVLMTQTALILKMGDALLEPFTMSADLAFQETTATTSSLIKSLSRDSASEKTKSASNATLSQIALGPGRNSARKRATFALSVSSTQTARRSIKPIASKRTSDASHAGRTFTATDSTLTLTGFAMKGNAIHVNSLRIATGTRSPFASEPITSVPTASMIQTASISLTMEDTAMTRDFASSVGRIRTAKSTNTASRTKKRKTRSSFAKIADSHWS